MEWQGVLFFFSIWGYALVWMLALPGLKAGHALLSALCGMLLAAYCGVIIAGWMAPTAWLLICGGLAGLAAGGVCVGLNLRHLRARLTSPGMLVFGLFLLYILWGAPGVRIQGHDDMSYWARAVKELYTFDRFYIHGGATMFHKDYIPLLPALQYSVVRVFGWQDAYLAFVTAACVAAALAALAEAFPRRWLGVLMAVLMFYAYRLYGFSIYDLRADGPMLMVFAAGLLCLFSREDDSFASLCPVFMVCAALPGFKIYSGLMYAAVVALGLAVEWIGAARAKRRTRALACVTLAGALAMAALQISWSVVYHSASAAAQVESAAAQAAYLGQQAAGAEASVPLSRLLSGNPRTQQLLQSFTPEKMQRLAELAGQTLRDYVSSPLIWTWAFLIPPFLLFPAAARRRPAICKALALTVLSAIIYLAGLLGSYLVQEETSGAALNYLSTASAPLLIAALFLTAWAGWPHARRLTGVLLALMTAGMAALCPPQRLIPRTQKCDYDMEAAVAVTFYEDEINGLLGEQDFGKRAFFIDASYQAAQVSSKSGKTHAYAYFGLPVRVLEPVYYVYGDYTQLETFDGEWLRQAIINSRAELLILRVEDFLYWEEVCHALELYGEDDSGVGVYDVTYANGQLSFAVRAWPQEE